MKASKFPLAVALAMPCVFVAMAVFNVLVTLHYQSADNTRISLLPYAIHYDLIGLVILAATGFAYAQWLIERRPLADFRWPSLLALAGIYLLVSGAQSWLWAYASLHLGQWLEAQTSALGISERLLLTSIVMLVSVQCLEVLCVLLSISATLLWLRRPGQAIETPAADYRGRAIAILTLFAWIWAIICVEAITIASPTLLIPEDSEQVSTPIMIGLPIGCLVLALPVLLGGLWALPRGLPRARPGRLLLASLLTMALSALAMLAITFAMLHVGLWIYGAVDFSPGLGFATLVGILWFIAAIPLAWSVVRLLFRRTPRAHAAA